MASFAPPTPRAADAPTEEFSAARAARHVETLAREPHPIGSAANAEARDYLAAELRALGFAVEVQRQAVAYQHARRPASSLAWVENVVGVKPGRGGGPALLLMSHYDSRWNAPGAADDGAGTAALLEIARALQATPLERDLVVLVTDGEEAGLLGAQAFVRHHPRAADIGLAINLDARGGTGRVLMFETSPGNGALVAGYAASVALPMANSLSYEVYRRMPNDTDLSITKAAGLPSINLGTVGGLFDYHSPTDVPANLDPGTVQHFGAQGLALARHFGNAPLPPAATEDRVYFDVFGRAMLVYPAWVDALITAATLLALALLVLRARRAGLATLGETALGALAFVLTLAFTALLAAAVFHALGGGGPVDEPRYWWGLARLDFEALVYATLALGVAMLSLHAYVRRLDWRAALARGGFLLAIALAGGMLDIGFALAVAALLAVEAWLFRRAHHAWGLALGALLTWGVALVAVTVFAPGAGFAFNLPLSAALAAHHWALGRRAHDFAAELALVAGAAWGFALFGLLTWLLHLSLGYANPGVPAVPAALALGLCMPVVLRAAAWRGALLPALAVLVSAALLVGHALLPPWSERQPRPSDLFVLVDHDAGRTRFASLDAERDAWQQAQVGVDADEVAAEVLIPGWQRALWLGKDAGAAAGAPTLTLLEAASNEGRRRLRLRYVPAAGELHGSLFMKSDAGIVALRWADVEVAVPEPRAGGWRRTRWFALPPEGVEILIELQGEAPLELRALGVAKGFPSPHGMFAAERPAATMPYHYGFGDATVTVKSFRF